jgi:uncharacterized protein YraI
VSNAFHRWRHALRIGLFGVGLLVSAAAAAQVAITTQAANVRAGPDRSYPLVAWLAAGTPVQVMGCINGWRWCDVLVGPNRGWVYSGFLSYGYQKSPTLILEGGPMLGLPLVTFSIGSYWDSYYRNRPWWGNRTYWYNRPLPPPPAWRPPPSRPPGYYPGPRPPHSNNPPPYRPPRPIQPGYRPPPQGGNPGHPGGSRPPSGRPPDGSGPGGGRPPGGGNPGGGHGGGNRPPSARPSAGTHPQQ